MDIGCGLILQNCRLAERKRWSSSSCEMKERKEKAKKWKCWHSGETCSRAPWRQKAWRFRRRQQRARSPWSRCRCRSLWLLTQRQRQTCSVQKYWDLKKFKRNNDKRKSKCWEKGERSEDVVWSRRGSGRSHKEKKRFAWVFCFFSLRMIVRMRGFAWMLLEWECWPAKLLL